MNRNSIFQQNVKCSLANYHWLTTCLIEIKVGYWQLLQVLVWVLVYWGEKQHTSLKCLVFLYTKICLFILAVLGLSCGTQDLQSLLPHMESSFPDQGLNPGPRHWEREVLAPGLPEKSPQLCSSWHIENPESLTLPSAPDIREVPGARESNINDHCHVRLPCAWHFYMLYV